MRTRVKFCGCTQPRDGVLAAGFGADAIGLIFAESAKRVDLKTAAAIARELPPFVTPVAVFANPTLEEVRRVCEVVPGITIQLHGDESPELVAQVSRNAAVIKTIHVKHGAADAARLVQAATGYPEPVLLFDSSVAGKSGGTGLAFEWQLIAGVVRKRRVIVSGGLNPENVGKCIRAVRPYAVDVRSGVETDGMKDVVKMRSFVQAVREADAA